MAAHFGGQALIEGVLMRGRTGVYAAVRAPDGRIVTRELALPQHRRGALGRLPLVRGVLSLADTLAFGSQMLLFSADIAAGGTGESVAPLSRRAAGGAALVAVGLFTVTPSLVAERLKGGKDAGAGERAGGLSPHLAEGAVRLSLLLAYLGVVGRMKDVQRVFAYHGAEHKSISALEAGVPLEPASVQQFPTAHPRCGTAFLFQSMITSTLVYGLVGKRQPLGRLGTRVALLPVVAGLSFEVLQFNARHLESPLVRLLNVPGMLLQRLTTRQPTDDQVEVALTALRGAMAMDESEARKGEDTHE
jgi:uncharacterized protein YqhQ